MLFIWTHDDIDHKPFFRENSNGLEIDGRDTKALITTTIHISSTVRCSIKDWWSSTFVDYVCFVLAKYLPGSNDRLVMMVALLQTIGKQLIEYFVVPVTSLLSKSNRDTFPEGFLVTFRENSLLQTTSCRNKRWQPNWWRLQLEGDWKDNELSTGRVDTKQKQSANAW